MNREVRTGQQTAESVLTERRLCWICAADESPTSYTASIALGGSGAEKEYKREPGRHIDMNKLEKRNREVYVLRMRLAREEAQSVTISKVRHRRSLNRDCGLGLGLEISSNEIPLERIPVRTKIPSERTPIRTKFFVLLDRKMLSF